MGLDMYLSKKTYVGNKYRDNMEQLQVVVPANQENCLFPIRGGEIKQDRISEITEEVAYWRKANAIHAWFVQYVQDGIDECQESYVDLGQLKELIEACKEDIEYLNTLEFTSEQVNEDFIYKEYKNVDENRMNLTPKGGFFFGSTKIDSHFVQDLQHTIDQLEPLLEEKGDFYYQSSW